MIFKYGIKYLILLIAVSFVSCRDEPGKEVHLLNKNVLIFPDYTGINIPPDIAPLNFIIKEKGDEFFVIISGAKGEIKISSGEGKIIIPIKKWKDLLAKNTGKDLIYDVFVKNNGQWNKYNSFRNKVSNNSIDQYLFYRLLYPGYVLWKEMGIYGRDVTTFEERPLIENKMVYHNCMNCHSFNQNSPDAYMFHVRGDKKGTVIYDHGKVKAVNVKTKDMMSPGVYPSWHPNGRFIAFSTNKIKQLFHAQGNMVYN